MCCRAVVRLALAMCLVSGFGLPAAATVTSGDASAFGVSLDLSGLINQDTGLVPAATVSSPGPASDTQGSPDLSGLPLIVSGTATANAESDVDGQAGDRFASADVTIGDFELDFTVLLDTVLAVNAGEISSTASVVGDHGSLVATGSSTFGDATITVNNVTFGLDPAYAPNTVLYDAGGILIIANQQSAQSGAAIEGLTVTALSISLLDVAGLSADIVLGQSQAVLTTVPEPSTALLLGLGLAALARRRSR